MRTIISVFAVMLAATVGKGQPFNQKDEAGLKQGKWKKTYANGRTRYEGEFKDNRPIGLFRYYYENGELKATNNHLPDGTVANHVYHRNGKIKAKGIYRHQLKDSLWQYFNENEVLILSEHYHLDTLHGPQMTYYANGQLAEELHFNKGEKHGPWRKYFQNGSPWVIAEYLDGNLHGEFITYSDTNKLKIQGKYHKGIRTGTWLLFSNDGSLRKKEIYRHARLQQVLPWNGEFTEYYDNEIPKSVYNYRAGKKQGEFKEYYNKGQWVKVERRLNGPEGEVELVEELQGTQLKMKGWYNNDQLNGKVTYYNEDGSIDRVEVYENGVLVSTIDWEQKQ